MSNRGLTLPPDDDGEQKPPRRLQSTGANIDPHRRQQAIELLAKGIPKSVIREALEMDFYTVSAIEREWLPELVHRRKHAADKAYEALTASLDSAQQRAFDGKASAVDAKFLSETWLNLAGEPSAILQVEHVFPQLEQFTTQQGGRVIDQSPI